MTSTSDINKFPETSNSTEVSADALMEAAQRFTLEELVAAREKVGYRNEQMFAITGFAYPLDNPLFYVKIPGDHTVVPTQQYVYDCLQTISPEQRQNVHVPKIYRIVPYKGSGFVIMGPVHGKTLRELDKEFGHLQFEAYMDKITGYYGRVSQGLKLLTSLPPPENATPGPVGGGYFRHPLFADFNAPMKFDSIDMLEKYINALAIWFKKTNPTVTLERKLILVFSDLHKGNFIFTDDGGLYIIDFADAAFLPPSFLTYTLHSPQATMSIDVASMVRKDFDLLMENLQVMRRVIQLTKIPVYKLGFREDQDRQFLARKHDAEEFRRKQKEKNEAQKKLAETKQTEQETDKKEETNELTREEKAMKKVVTEWTGDKKADAAGAASARPC